MVWQDLAIMITQFVIAGALIPTVINKHKPAQLTSIIDGSALVFLMVIFLTMGLWLSAIGAGLSAGLWFTLLWQVQRLKKGHKNG